MPWPKTGATNYHAQLELQCKVCKIKRMVVCNDWDLEPLDLLNGLALCCYQLAAEVFIVSISLFVHVYILILMYILFLSYSLFHYICYNIAKTYLDLTQR